MNQLKKEKLSLSRKIDPAALSPQQMAALLIVQHAELAEQIDLNNGFGKALEQICSAPDAITIDRIRFAQNRWSEAMNEITARGTEAACEIMGIKSDIASLN